MQIIIEEINHKNKIHHNKSNEEFAIFGRLEIEYQNHEWIFSEVIFDEQTSKKYNDEDLDLDDYIDMDDKTIFYATENGQVLGQVVIRKNWNRYCYIDDIGVKAEARRKNIGTKLLESAQLWAENAKLHGFMLETHDTNLSACRFYKMNGFILGGVDTMLYNNFDNKDEKALFWYKKF